MRHVDHVVLVAAALGTACATLPAIHSVRPAVEEMHGDGAADLACVIATVIVSHLLVRIALATRSAFGAAAVSAFGGIIAGIANTGLCLFVVTLTKGKLEPSAFFIGCLFGCGYGMMLGLVFGCAYAVLAAFAVGTCARPSMDASDHVLAGAAAWLGATVLASVVVDPAPRALYVAASITAAVALVAAVVRAAKRRAWLKNVARGLDARWAVVPRVRGANDAGLVPYLRVRDADACTRVLVERTQVGSSPYRGEAPDVPRALVR